MVGGREIGTSLRAQHEGAPRGAAHRHLTGRRREHARERAHPLDDLGVEDRGIDARGLVGRRKAVHRGEHPFALEAEVDALEVQRGSRHQGRAGEEDDRDRDLGADHCAPTAQTEDTRAGPDRGPPTAQSLARVGARRLPRREQPDQEADPGRQREGEPEDPPVDAQGLGVEELEPTTTGGPERLAEPPADGVHAEHRQSEAEQPAEEGQREGLGQELSYQAEAACAEGRANRGFRTARGASGEQKPGQIGGSDEEHEKDSGEERDHRRLRDRIAPRVREGDHVQRGG